jgi:FkbM family methyltransferase
MNSPFDVFLAPEALHINRARLDHLAGLRLDLHNKRVLEVGAGIGLHTAFFEERGCDILSTDGNSVNVAEMMRRYPQRRLGLLDLDQHLDLTGLGSFDVIYCYGTLYHLRFPDRALAQLAAICSGVILLETVVLPGNYPELQLIAEPLIANQALCGAGCRPTRPWVMGALRRHFGYAYTTLDQPDYPDFITDWSIVNHDGNLRAVFVGSKQPLMTFGLTDSLPMRHRNCPPRAGKRYRHSRVWIDVGAHNGEHSIAAAIDDPSLLVHAFEPLPALHNKLVLAAPPNFTAHAMAVSDQDGFAAFRVNCFDAASSLLPMDENARAAWTDGNLLREEREILVPTTRLDTFMRDNGIATIEFLKIDAQGGDFSVVRSLGDRIGDVKRVQLEVVPGASQLYRGAADKATILTYLAKHGFVLESTEVQSHGQEENLTFARPSSAAQPAASREEESEEIEGLYDVPNYATVAGTVRLFDDALEVTTAPAQWAYAAVIPVDRTRAPEGSTVRLTLSLEVDSGTLQVGVLNQAETEFIATVSLEAGPQRTVELVVLRSKRMGRLVVRNASAEGSSHGWCRLVTTIVNRQLEDGFEVVHSEEAPNAEEASFLATQIRASAQTLSRIRADGTCPPELITEVGEATELLRALLSRGSLALIRTQPGALGAVFAGVDIEILRQLADHLKILLPLRPIPGWRFDEFGSRPDLATLLRHALWRTLHHLPNPPAVALPWHRGTTFNTRFDNDLSLAMFVGGTYEPNEFAFLDGLLRPGMKVLDGGANEGVYTLFLANKVGPNGRVVAVEPSPRELTRLRANLAANNLNDVTVVAAVLAERAGDISLKIADAGHAGQNTLGEFIYEGLTPVETELLPAITLDELAATRGLTDVDVIKLDIEGAELRALRGATNLLQTARPLLLLELSPAALAHQGGSVKDLTALLERADYRLLCFDRATGLPVPVPEGSFSDNLLAVHRARDWGLPIQ